MKKYELKTYEIWIEGFAATGQAQDASCLGKHKGRNFQDACMRYWLKKEIEARKASDRSNTYYSTKRWDYDPYSNTYWACRMFDNEEEARKSFG